MSSSHEVDDSGDPLADVTEETEKLRTLAREILETEEGQPLGQEVLQRTMTSLVKCYAVSHQKGERFSPFVADVEMPPTAVLILVTDMLRAVNVDIFELGMWQAWSGA